MDPKEAEEIFNTCRPSDRHCIICREKIEEYIPGKIMYIKTKITNENLFFHESCYERR